jgi:FAD/FMN-containing dehydrogenase
VDLSAFAEAVGEQDPVGVVGAGTRGAPPGGRQVRAPGGIAEYQPEEMTVRCGAGTPVEELAAALASDGQEVALPAGGTVGGALAVGRSDVLRLGRGPVREVLLQARFVGASGDVVKAGGPTVKNVSGYDLCRLLVGSWGTLGFLGEVIVRTRPVPAARVWVGGEADPFALRARLHRPQSVLWDGVRVWVCLSGHPTDVADQARLAALPEVEGPPLLPTGGRASMAPSALRELPHAVVGRFVAEVGVGVVHLDQPWPRPAPPAAVVELHRRIKSLFDPAGRLNPDVDVLTA